MRQKWLQKPPLGTPINFSHPSAKGLMLDLEFQEGGGDLANDLSGNANHGTLKNMAFPPTAVSGWNAGRKGHALSFDGTNDYVDCGNDASLDIIDAITIEAWIKRGSGGDTFQRIVDKNTAAYTFYITRANNRLSCYIVWADSTTTDIYTNSPIISIGVWTHVVLTYSKADGKITFYKNAVASEYSGYGKSIKSVGDTVYIGDRADTGRSYHGQIDQVRIYNRALSAEEVQQSYISPFGRFERTKWGLLVPSPVSGLSIPVAMHNYRRQRA